MAFANHQGQERVVQVLQEEWSKYESCRPWFADTPGLSLTFPGGHGGQSQSQSCWQWSLWGR